MIGAILGIVKSLFPTIDKAVVDKDQARQLKHDLEMAVLAMDAKEVENATKVIVAEAQGESWLQRNWRPLTMLSFVGLIGSYWLGLAPDYLIQNPEVVDSLFGIVQVGIGGYVIGRSAEKVMKHYKEPEVEKAKSGHDKD